MNKYTDFTISCQAPIDNTMRVRVVADQLLEINRIDQSLQDVAVQSSWLADSDALVIGGGSNILFATTQVKKAIRVTASQYGFINRGDDVLAFAEAGLGLDEWVRLVADRNLYGLERLAEIPGTVGAAPIQNVGAYGVQLSDILDSVELWDRQNRLKCRWRAEECHLSYRNSRFKAEPNRWLVLRVWVRLAKTPPPDWPRLDYPGLAEEAERYDQEHHTTPSAYTARDMARIITRVRRAKLPDWRQPLPGSLGSFFHNPVVPLAIGNELKKKWPAMPMYAVDAREQVKLSAGWLIEQAGWRGKKTGAAGVYHRHALVLVNHGEAQGAHILQLAQTIQSDVLEKFGIQLQPEPLIYSETP